MARPRENEDLYTPRYDELLAKGAKRSARENIEFRKMQKDIRRELDHRKAARKKKAKQPTSFHRPVLVIDHAADANPEAQQLGEGSIAPDVARAAEAVPRDDPWEDREPVPLDDGQDPEGGAQVEDLTPQDADGREPPPISLDTMEARREFFRNFLASQFGALDEVYVLNGIAAPKPALQGMCIEAWTIYAESKGWLQGDVSERMALFAATAATGAVYGPPTWRLMAKAKERRSKASATVNVAPEVTP